MRTCKIHSLGKENITDLDQFGDFDIDKTINEFMKFEQSYDETVNKLIKEYLKSCPVSIDELANYLHENYNLMRDIPTESEQIKQICSKYSFNSQKCNADVVFIDELEDAINGRR